MKSRTVCVAAALMALSAVASAENYYLRVTGATQKAFIGGVIKKGVEDTMGVRSFNHSIVSPRDPQSGLPTGKRMHKPLVVTISLDKSSTQFFNALTKNENLTIVELEIWAPQIKAIAGMGAERKVATIKLSNANIASITTLDAPENKMAPNGPTATFLEISFTYQKIEWTWMDNGKMAGDDWEARV